MQLGLPFVDGTTGEVPPSGAASPERFLFVRHRRARRYVLRVCPDGLVRVTIPRGGSRRDAGAFVERHRDWIARERARLANATLPPNSLAQLRRRASAELPERLEQLAELHGLKVTRTSIRNQRTRWGSCGRNGHISINWRLILMPEWVRDYVLIHELMHLRRLDHSPHFWRLVASACPRYRDARAWLRANGPALR
jgi:predicted metal-dependent hydrolase